MENLSIIKRFSLSAKMRAVTGIRVGGNNARIEVGNVDNVVIKNPFTGLPFVPGSSLKGKMRTLLQYELGFVDPSSGSVWTISESVEYYAKQKATHSYERDPVLRIFGTSSDKKGEWKYGPSRLIVRDANLCDGFEKKHPSEILEIKTEVAIDRLTGTAAKSGPRQMERVVAGAVFDVNMVFRVFNIHGSDVDEEMFYRYIPRLFNLLELDSIGGCGSRGYGKVEFSDYKLKEIPFGKTEKEVEEKFFSSTEEFVSKTSELVKKAI